MDVLRPLLSGHIEIVHFALFDRHLVDHFGTVCGSDWNKAAYSSALYSQDVRARGSNHPGHLA